MILKISTELKNPKKEVSRVWVTCPSCKRKDWYYSLWVEKCDLCGFDFGNIRKMPTDIDRRLVFHIKGD